MEERCHSDGQMLLYFVRVNYCCHLSSAFSKTCMTSMPSVRGWSLSRGGLCPGVSVHGGLCPETPFTKNPLQTKTPLQTGSDTIQRPPCEQTTGADPGLPVGGTASLREGAATYGFGKFSKKLHEIEKILDCGWGCARARHAVPLRSVPGQTGVKTVPYLAVIYQKRKWKSPVFCNDVWYQYILHCTGGL